jgi:hypothetical protein
LWCTIALKQKTLKDVHTTLTLYHQSDFRQLPRYNTLVDEVHRATPLFFQLLVELLSAEEAIRIMDSTMLEVCKLHRADDYKVVKTKVAFGKNWQGWHYGFKLHASTSLDGILTSIALTAANVHDAQMEYLLLNKYAKLAVGDTLYGASVVRERMYKRYGTIIIAPPHPKQKKKLITPWQLKLLEHRSKIESVFDYLKEHLHLVSSFPHSMNSRRLADLARRSDIDVILEIVPDMQHVFEFLAGTAPEGDAAVRRLADWVRLKLGLG